jgi:ABC-type transporter Mla maintaining outer membrane lipid asymmetry ATPase subunit MlaF
VTDPVLEISGVVKDYRGLRPLRIERLMLAAGESLALVGFDGPMAETFVNLVTGASLPDSGEVKVFGRSTATVTESDEWLALVDRFGIVSERAVLLDAFSVVQNLAIPFTLDIDPLPDDVRGRAEQLAAEVGLSPGRWHRPVGELGPADRARMRLARAVALNPAVIILEHPEAGLSRQDMEAFARAVRTTATRRAAATVALAGDPRMASVIASRVLTIKPATGALYEERLQWLRNVLR